MSSHRRRSTRLAMTAFTAVATLAALVVSPVGAVAAQQPDAIELAAPASIALEPEEDTNPVGSTHELTATVTDELDNPVEGVEVSFDVTSGGTPVPPDGTGTTNADGEATFTYTNSEAGVDTIEACFAAEPVFQVNAGGPAIDGWSEDTETIPSPFVNAIETGNETFTTAEEIAMSDPSIPEGTPPALLQTERWDPEPAPEMQWAFPVVPGNYEVRLYFSEIFPGNQSVGARVFDVTIEGTVVLDDYDIFADVGGFAGVMKSFDVESDALLDIVFGHVVESPKIGAIEILPEVCDTATKTWEDPAPTTISLAPATDTNPVDTDHTVTATVEDQFGEPFEGADVHFDVDAAGAPDPTSGDDVTDAAGEATFTFTNTEAATNSITGCIDADANQTCDVGEVVDTAEKVWEARVATAISLDPATATNEVDTDHTVTATVVDQVGDPVQGVAVLFDVSAEGTPAPTTGSDVTDVNGEGTFTFTNSTADVTNTITVCMDTDPENGVCDVGEETDTATKAWEAEEPPETCPGFEADPRNQIVGTPGDDVLEGTPGDDIICGLGGDDTMAGLGGDDLILGGPGDDTASGGAGEDVLIGHGGADSLVGGPDDDVLRGNAGRDILRGGGGSDLLIGGGNRDILQGGGDDDILRGNAGNDVLRGGGGDDNLRGGGGRDAIRGGSGDDTLRGGGGNDDLRAGGGDDRVFGGSGDDVLRGGAGNDLLNGGAGTDSCAGGPGSDVLVNCES